MKTNRLIAISITSTIFFTLMIGHAVTVSQDAINSFELGLSLMKTNPAQAILAFEKSHLEAPNWSPPLYEEGILLSSKNPEKALQALHAAASLTPKNGDIWNAMGWIAYSAHDFSQSVFYFKQEVSVTPQSAGARWGLANVYDDASVRDFAQARIELTSLLTIPAYRTVALKMLSQLPPDAVDQSFFASAPITEQDALAMAFSYRVYLPTVSDYVNYALARGYSTPTNTPATRLDLALFLNQFYGIDQFEYIRPFPFRDLQGVSIDDQMAINSAVATGLFPATSPTTFSPFATMSRRVFASILVRDNAIMSHPFSDIQLQTPPAPAKNPLFVYFFSISTPSIQSVQIPDMIQNAHFISAIGFSDFSFVDDTFAQKQAASLAAIDTLSSASPDVQAEWDAATTHNIAPYMILGNYNDRTEQADPALIHTILHSNSLTVTLIQEVLSTVTSEHLRGVTVDFENIYPSDRIAFVSFLTKLHTALQSLQIPLMVCLPEQDRSEQGKSAYDYAAIGQIANTVMLITYDEHTPHSAPGQISTLSNTTRVIQYAVQNMNPNKILVGIADYGYNWSQGSAVTVSMSQAVQLANQYHAHIRWDENSQTPTFSYLDTNGVPHIVWFENQKSIEEITKLVPMYGLKGISVWNLGSENQNFWKAIIL